MKYLQQALITLSLITLVFFGCKKEYSYESPNGPGNNGVYQWAFTETTNSFLGPMDSARVDTMSSVKVLTMTGHSADKKDIITLQVISDSIKVGVYQTPKCTFDYLRNGINLYQSDINATGQFTLTITAMDSISITGTFSGTAPDTAKKAKTITAGTFKVKYKSSTGTVTPPPVCKISKLLYVDSASGGNFYSLYSTFSLNTVNKIYLSDSSTQLLSATFPVSYSTGKISVDASGKQYFTLDASGRVNAFYGHQDPAYSTSDSDLIVANYTYDGSGHLIKRTHTYKLYPTIVAFEMDYTYSGDLLTLATVKSGTTLEAQVSYEYDNSKQVTGFLDLHPFADEIFYFQSAINTGIVCNRALVKVTETDYTGTTPVTYVSHLNNYVIDANKYVQSFSITGDSFDAPFAFSFLSMYNSTTYKLFYHCQ